MHMVNLFHYNVTHNPSGFFLKKVQYVTNMPSNKYRLEINIGWRLNLNLEWEDDLADLSCHQM